VAAPDHKISAFKGQLYFLAEQADAQLTPSQKIGKNIFRAIIT